MVLTGGEYGFMGDEIVELRGSIFLNPRDVVFILLHDSFILVFFLDVHCAPNIVDYN